MTQTPATHSLPRGGSAIIETFIQWDIRVRTALVVSLRGGNAAKVEFDVSGLAQIFKSLEAVA